MKNFLRRETDPAYKSNFDACKRYPSPAYHYSTHDAKEVKKAWERNEYNVSCNLGRIDGCIKKVIFNNPATIVFRKDGTKTVVKCQEGDIFDREKGLTMAICKKIMGNKSNFNNQFKRIFKKKTEIKAEKRLTELMDRERAISILINNVARLEEVMKENSDHEGFKEYKEALEFAVTELSKDNQTVPVWVNGNGMKVQCYLDKSREIIFNSWMTASFAENKGYEWEEVKEET